jgi:uncharacterized repeat protein (TIGR03803 family)
MLPSRFSIILTLAVCATALGVSAFASGREKVLYTFKGGNDGAIPAATLVLDAAGNLYGTTIEGGGASTCVPQGCGTVFELSPSGDGKWREKVLYAFNGGADGANPESGLILDAAGNLYGTTPYGGNSGSSCGYGGCGTVFELTPNADGSWREILLYAFRGNPDGAGPVGTLVFDKAGNLYGTTYEGGDYQGTVFKLSPPTGGQDSWTESVIYTFRGGPTDAGSPLAGLVFDSEGKFYGTTYQGGNGHCGLGCGAVFELQEVDGSWKETVLYSFQGGGNGRYPTGGLTVDATGNFYGTLDSGGNGYGAAVKLKKVGSVWKETMIYDFCSHNNCSDGANPVGLTFDSSGKLYGVTFAGGSANGGVLFRLQDSSSGWMERVLYTFPGYQGDGINPTAAMIFDGNGNMYGPTSSLNLNGNIVEFTP